MDKRQLQGFRRWFTRYVKEFYTGQPRNDAHIRLKQVHTNKVCQEMRYLAGGLSLSENDGWIAETIALFHDTGRFEQYRRYQTFMDARSENHSLLGLQVLSEHRVLDPLIPEERQIIETAIHHHGQKDLPEDLPCRQALFCKLIRDADKIDIYRVILKNYREYEKCPEGFVLDVPLPDSPGYNPDMVQAVLEGRTVSYSDLQTVNDVKLMQLGWIQDINFPATLERIHKRGYVRQLLSLLPDDENISWVGEHVNRYLRNRLSQAMNQPQRS
ncbi:MAG: HD domain-containing protein [Sedimentisphaerales bacterium]|nr:HD domain-containing protein [Sedimentisphaerales bacterium]